MKKYLVCLIPVLLLIGATFTTINPNIVPIKVPLNYILLLFLFFLFVIYICTYQKASKEIGWALLLFLGLISSVFNSEYKDVVLFKLILFVMGLIAMIFGTQNAMTNHRVFANRLFNHSLYGIVLCSYCVFLLGLGFTVNETGFSGVLNHPQAFAVLLTLITVYLFIYNQEESKYRTSYIWFCLCVFLLYKTESRTAMISVFVSTTIYVLYSKERMRSQYKNYVKKVVILLVFGGLIAAFGQTVISKNGRSEAKDAVGALQNSRLRFAISSYENFLQSPITGIGFQVSNGYGSHYQMNVVRGPFNIPIKASIEKGSFIPSLFEEVGIVGAVFFIFYMFRLFNRNKDILTKLIILTVLLISFGEAAMFSFGGVGLFIWLFVFVSFFRAYRNEK